MSQLFSLETEANAERREFLNETLKGLSLPQKSLPSRFFYDARGSELFEEITKLPEYYPTRTEIALLDAIGGEIGNYVPSGALVIEFGSGSSLKTERLLKSIERPSAYAPIEISETALFPAARRINSLFPSVSVHPILGGFHDLDAITLPVANAFRLGFFPGSTIGNFTRAESISFLRSARALLGKDAAFLIGADLVKPLHILLPAYNDSRGVTAAFNLNLLARINRELNGAFNLRAFSHAAIFNETHSRIEMHLRSKSSQKVYVGGRAFSFHEGETIHTENSHKYTIQDFHTLASEAGWKATKTWVDESNLFSLHILI